MTRTKNFSLTEDAREAYQTALGADHVEFESRCLSIGSEYLPECALRVLADRDDDSAEYWGWLLDQHAEMSGTDASSGILQ